MTLKAKGSNEICSTGEVKSSAARQTVDSGLHRHSVIGHAVTHRTKVAYVYSRALAVGGEFKLALKRGRRNYIFCTGSQVEERENVGVSRISLNSVKIDLIFLTLIIGEIVVPLKARRCG